MVKPLLNIKLFNRCTIDLLLSDFQSKPNWLNDPLDYTLGRLDPTLIDPVMKTDPLRPIGPIKPSEPINLADPIVKIDPIDQNMKIESIYQIEPTNPGGTKNTGARSIFNKKQFKKLSRSNLLEFFFHVKNVFIVVIF